MRFSKSTWMLSVLVTLCLLGQLGQLTTACCETKESLRDPEVLVVDTAEIREGEKPGEYVVTEAWLLERIEYEQGLMSALERCEAGE